MNHEFGVLVHQRLEIWDFQCFVVILAEFEDTVAIFVDGVLDFGIQFFYHFFGGVLLEFVQVRLGFVLDNVGEELGAEGFALLKEIDFENCVDEVGVVDVVIVFSRFSPTVR